MSLKNKSGRTIAAAAIILLAVFLVLTLVVHRQHLNQFDFNATVKIQDRIPKPLDAVLSVTSLVGSFELTTLMSLAAVAVTGNWTNLFLFVVYGAGHVIEIAGKTFLTHAGPPFLFFRYDLGVFFPSAYVQAQSSFPSGHSMRAVFLVILTAFLLWQNRRLNRTVGWVMTAVLVLLLPVMLVSRVSLGEHWTTDVVGGSLLGASMALISIPFIRLRHKKKAGHSQ